MKLIEKKCPNCGAELKFDKDDTEVKCNYCETNYEIQRDPSLDELLKNAVDASNFILHKKMFTGYRKGITIFTIIVFCFILCVFFIIFFNVFPRLFR